MHDKIEVKVIAAIPPAISNSCQKCDTDNIKCLICFTEGFIPVTSGQNIGECVSPCVEGTEVTFCKVCSTTSAKCSVCYTDIC